jgi:hypothetical protein
MYDPERTLWPCFGHPLVGGTMMVWDAEAIDTSH